jgi:tRNA 2-selenouridine synthase
MLWKAMSAAPRFEVLAPVEARARYLVTAYADMIDNPARLGAVIDRLRNAHSRDQVDVWQAMAQSGAFTDLAASLMAEHYDPRYTRHRARLEHGVTGFAISDLGDAALDGLANRLAAAVG